MVTVGWPFDPKLTSPGVATITEIKAWMRPVAHLAGYEPLYDGLRMAGVREE
jgi:hypothetical protein